MFDEEEYARRGSGIPNTNINKDEDGIYEPYEPLEYDLIPYSFFVIAKIVLGMALVICLPFLLIDFSSSIKGYLILLALFSIVTIISKIFKFTYLD